MRMRTMTRFPMLAPLITAGVVRVDDPKADVTEPVRENVRPHAHAGRTFVISTRTALRLAAMTAAREAERASD